MTSAADITVDTSIRQVRLGWRSRLALWFLRLFIKPSLARMIRGGPEKITRRQLAISKRNRGLEESLPIDYRMIGPRDAGVPGHVVGDLKQTDGPVLLWLHGGAYILPAVPEVHVKALQRLCRDLGAAGFMPDYRLAPANPYPAGLDDCERAYRALLDAGFDAEKIALGGDSAGGNLVLGLLQRIRRNDLPMPACAVCLSPATDSARLHNPAYRIMNVRREAMLPLEPLQSVVDMYLGSASRVDPEVSPIYADFKDFPPMLLMASDAEILCGDSVLLARRAKEQGVDVELMLWSHLPHVFPLLESVFPEAAVARQEMSDYFKKYLQAVSVADC